MKGAKWFNGGKRETIATTLKESQERPLSIFVGLAGKTIWHSFGPAIWKRNPTETFIVYGRIDDIRLFGRFAKPSGMSKNDYSGRENIRFW